MKFTLVIAALAAVLVTGCASFKAQRMDDRGIDDKSMSVTDKWVNGDTILVLNETMEKLRVHQRLLKYKNKLGDRPIKLFVAEIQNNTSEPYFPIKDLEEALLERLSENDMFVLINASQREKLLKEITYQNDGMVDPAQAKKIGKQSGADSMIFGTVNMKPEERGGKTIKTYSVNFNLTDLETSEEIARTRSVINKYSERSGGN